MCRVASVLAAMLVLLVAVPAAAFDCRAKNGTQVVLYGSMDDPDVLVWDSNLRLKEYGVATFDESQLLLAHALIAQPGTRATIAACIPRFVTTKFSTTVEDAVEITIQSGPLRGHVGWINETAMRFQRPTKNR